MTDFEQKVSSLSGGQQKRVALVKIILEEPDFLILDAVRKSGGCALTVTEEEMFAAWRQFSALTGLFCAPEGAATLAALQKLREQQLVGRDERVVLFNTGSGLKYLEAWAEATA